LEDQVKELSLLCKPKIEVNVNGFEQNYKDKISSLERELN